MELKTTNQLYNLWRNALNPFENFVIYIYIYIFFFTADNIWRPEM